VLAKVVLFRDLVGIILTAVNPSSLLVLSRIFVLSPVDYNFSYQQKLSEKWKQSK
jgi:hypothetical protein